jgi:hypothetical protein
MMEMRANEMKEQAAVIRALILARGPNGASLQNIKRELPLNGLRNRHDEFDFQVTLRSRLARK